MKRHEASSSLPSEFDYFLFAPIGKERNGMLISVLSLLARVGIDPWQEAARLAAQPRQIAARRLTSLLSALPGRQTTAEDPGTVAAKLLALLPPQRTGGDRARTGFYQALFGLGSVSHPWVILYVVCMALLLGSEYLVAGHEPLAPETAPRAEAATPK
jgi:hypothetical protein